MSASTKLSTAVKALCYLAESYPEPKSSTQISNRIGANASKLRQLLSMLSKQKIVKSEKGISGGFILTKSPKILHMQEIYCAIEDRKAFHLDVCQSNGESVSETEKFNSYFFDLFADVQIDIENKMKNITILKIMESLQITSKYDKE